jgi:hypothetical protein
MIIQGKNRAFLYDFDNSTKNSFDRVIRSSGSDKYLFLSEEKKINYYSLVKNRKIA